MRVYQTVSWSCTTLLESGQALAADMETARGLPGPCLSAANGAGHTSASGNQRHLLMGDAGEASHAHREEIDCGSATQPWA